MLDDVVAGFAPDLVLAYWLYPDAYGALLSARRAGLPLVAGARGSDIRVRDPVSRRLTRTVVGGADRLLVVSRDLGRLGVSDYGADPAQTRAATCARGGPPKPADLAPNPCGRVACHP